MCFSHVVRLFVYFMVLISVVGGGSLRKGGSLLLLRSEGRFTKVRIFWLGLIFCIGVRLYFRVELGHLALWLR